MLVRAATTCMVVAWVVSKLHHFQLHYHAHWNKWHSAQLLLDSDVCSNASVRMALRDFDQCDDAELFVHIHPFNRAVYSLAEEMHVCGNNRCAIFYMDVTDRLPYIFSLVFLFLVLVILKLAKDYKNGLYERRIAQFHLPHHKTD